MSRFSVSVSLSSLSWRRRQDQRRNQENQEEITQRQSHLNLLVSRVMSYVWSCSFFCSFVIFLFNLLHPSDQSSVEKSSAQPFVTEAIFDATSESELSSSVASLALLKQITSAVTSVIMSMAAAGAVKAAQEAAASALDHPEVSDDVVMLSEDPILIVNSQDQASLKSAAVRTKSGQSSQCQGSPSAELQLLIHWSSLKYVVMTSLPSPRMDTYHLSEDVKLFASDFKTSGDTLDFKRFMETKNQRFWVILNDAEFKLYQQHHSLQVPRVKDSAHLLNWKLHQSLQDTIYHMIYLTVAHCIRHGSPASSPDLATVYTIASGVMLDGHLQHLRKRISVGSSLSTSGSKLVVASSCQASWMRCRSRCHSHLFSDQVEVQVSSCQVTFPTMSQCQYQIDSSVRCSAISFLIAQLASTNEFFTHEAVSSSSLVSILSEFAGSRDGVQALDRRVHGQAVILCRGIDHLTSSRRSSSDGITIIANGFNIRLWSVIIFKLHGQVSNDQLQVISISLRISSCGAQQSRAHSHAHSLRFTTDQVLKESVRHWSSFIVIKYGSEHRQHHSSASVQLMVRLSSSPFMLIVK